MIWFRDLFGFGWMHTGAGWFGGRRTYVQVNDGWVKVKDTEASLPPRCGKAEPGLSSVQRTCPTIGRHLVPSSAPAAGGGQARRRGSKGRPAPKPRCANQPEPAR